MTRKIFQKGLSILLALAMMLSLLPGMSLTVKAATDIGTTITDADYTLYYNVAEGKMYKITFSYSAGSSTTSTYERTFLIGEEVTSSGWTAEGSTLTLNNLNFTTTSDVGILFSGDATLVLNGTNSIVTSGASVSSCGILMGDSYKYGRLQPSQNNTYNLTIREGSEGGALLVKTCGSTNIEDPATLQPFEIQSGITAKNLTMDSGNVTVEAGGTYMNYPPHLPTTYLPNVFGIFIGGSAALSVNGGVLKVTSGEAFANSYAMYSTNGYIYNDATVELTAGKGNSSAGIYCSTKFEMYGNAKLTSTASEEGTYSYGAYINGSGTKIFDNAKMELYGATAGLTSSHPSKKFSHIVVKGGNTSEARDVLTYDTNTGRYPGTYAFVTAEPQYTATIGNSDYGSATVSTYGQSAAAQIKAYAGDTMSLKASSVDKTKYRFMGWQVSGEALSIPNSERTSFKMPAADVTITPLYEEYISAKTITLNKTELNYTESQIGERIKLTAEVTPSDVTVPGVNWSSDNSRVATVDEEGNVEITGCGTTVITAESADGMVKATCKVKVSGLVEGIKIYPTDEDTFFTISGDKPYYKNGDTTATTEEEGWNAKFDAATGTLYIKDLDLTCYYIEVEKGDLIMDASGTNKISLEDGTRFKGDVKLQSSNSGILKMTSEYNALYCNDFTVGGSAEFRCEAEEYAVECYDLKAQDSAKVTISGDCGLYASGNVQVEDSAKVCISGESQAAYLTNEPLADVKGSASVNGSGLTEKIVYTSDMYDSYYLMEDGSQVLYLEFTPKTAKEYSVTVQNDGNGTAKASVTTAEKGTKVTLTATPKGGYQFKEWQVVSGGITITDSSFTMPECDVVIKAIFKATEEKESEPEEKKPGKIENTTEPKDNAFSTNLDETPAELSDKVLTEAEKEQVAAGESVKIYLEVKDISDTVSKTDKKLVEEAKGNATLGMYLDLSLYKKIGSNEPKKVANTNGTVSITIKVPKKLINKDSSITRTYQIVRIHNGKAKVINCKYDAKAGTITFETDAFSAYALVYKDAAKDTNKPDSDNNNEDSKDSNKTNPQSGNNSNSGQNQTSTLDNGNASNVDSTNTAKGNTGVVKPTSPKTGDSSNLILWFGLMLAAVVGAAGITVCQRKKSGKEE